MHPYITANNYYLLPLTLERLWSVYFLVEWSVKASLIIGRDSPERQLWDTDLDFWIFLAAEDEAWPKYGNEKEKWKWRKTDKALTLSDPGYFGRKMPFLKTPHKTTYNH